MHWVSQQHRGVDFSGATATPWYSSNTMVLYQYQYQLRVLLQHQVSKEV